MGNVQSTGQEAFHLAGQLANRHGFQILRVHANSPVSEVQVFPYFDYIIAINGVIVTQELPNIIGEMAKNHVNKPLKLTLYNSRRDEQRDVTIVPRTGWGGDGLLGCAIRFCPLEGVRDRVWHILNVHPNSPAEKAGLKAHFDYIVASPDFVIRSEADFYELITQNTKKPVKLIVFDAESDSIRQVEIVPDFEWGGEGCVGCDIGTGMLHWIPTESTKTEHAAKPLSPIIAPESSAKPQASPIQSSQAQAPVPQLLVPQVLQPVQAHPIQPLPMHSQPVQSQSIPSQPTQVFQAQPPHPVQIPSIVVAAPTSRPVFDTLSTSSVPAPFAPMQSAPPVGPPRPQYPPQQLSPAKPPVISTAEFVFDDIPKPNFTVSSDLFNQQQQQ